MGLASAGVLAALVVVFFLPGLFFGKVPIYRDLMVLVLPLRSYAARAIFAGEFPLWTPDIFFGAPFFANYQSALLYPPSVILYLVPLPAGLSLFFAFHLFMAGWGMERYLRRRCGVGPASSLFGGTVFAFGGFLASLIPLTNQLQAAAWLPWILEAGEECASTGGVRWLVRLAMLVTLQWLGGAPEAAFLTAAALVACATRVVLLGGGSWRRLAAVATALVLGISLSAAQLLPAVEYALQTDRADALPFSSVVAESLQPASLLQFLIPHRFEGGAPGFVPGQGLPLFWSLYVGVAPLLLAAVRPPIFWVVVIALSTALALGPHLPFLAAAYAILPGIVGLFRFPAKFFLPSHLAFAVLAAEGLSRIFDDRHRARTAILAAAILTIFGLAISAFAIVEPQRLLLQLGFRLRGDLAPAAYAHIASSVARTSFRLALLAFAIGALLWLFARERISAHFLGFMLFALTFFDLLLIHQPPLVFTDWRSLRAAVRLPVSELKAQERIFHYCTDAPRCLPPSAPGLGPWSGTVRIGEDVEEKARELWAALIPDVPLLYGLGAVAGSDGFSTRDQREFYRALALLPRDGGLRMLAALGVRNLIGPSRLEGVGLEQTFESVDPAVWVYALPDAAPHVYLAEQAFSAPDVPSALMRISGPAFRAGRDVVVVGGRTEEQFSPGTLTDLTLESSRILARVSLSGAGFLVVSDTLFPGWEATVDDAPTEILRVNGFLRGVRVPAGEHRVSVHYRPAAFHAGLAGSAAAGVTLLAVATFSFLRRKKNPRHA